MFSLSLFAYSFFHLNPQSVFFSCCLVYDETTGCLENGVVPVGFLLSNVTLYSISTDECEIGSFAL